MRLLVRTAAREVLLVAVCLVAWSLLPALAGMTVTTVMSDSMAPGIRSGDVVVARPVTGAQLTDGAVRLGSVLLVDDPDRPGRLRLHRWVGMRDGALELRGDANAAADSSAVAPAAVHAVGFLRVPLAGLPVLWVRTGQAAPLAGAGAVLLLLVRLAFPVPSSRPRPPPRAGRRPGRDLRRRSAVAVVLPMLAVVLGGQPGTGAVYSKLSTPSKSNFASQATFDCFVRTYPNVPAASLRWNYTATGANAEADQSGNGHDGKVQYVSMRNAATCGGNPFITITSTNTYAYQTAAVPSPAQFGVSIWFRTSTPQGKLVGFGNVGAGSSTTYDRHVYMSSTGLLTFGVQTDAGRTTCSSAGTFSDGAWHLVVATYASGSLTMWTDDGQQACTATASGTIQSYTGVWQVGNDALDRTVWANASSASNFKGDLDETAVYDAPLTPADERAIYAAGR